MTDKEFFRKTLGLEEPWEVLDVSLDMEGKRVEVVLRVEAGTLWCEEGGQLPVAGYEEREWRHLDTMQLETVLRARVPRVRYPGGKTRMVKVPLGRRAFALDPELRGPRGGGAASEFERGGWRKMAASELVLGQSNHVSRGRAWP